MEVESNHSSLLTDVDGRVQFVAEGQTADREVTIWRKQLVIHLKL